MKNLLIDLKTFPFYEREVFDGKYVKNKCGRDFLYYALCYYLPSKYGNEETKKDALALDKNRILGLPVPSFLAWTQVQFSKTAKYLESENLYLKINNKKIKNFFDFVGAILFSRIHFADAIKNCENAVDFGLVSGIDISIGLRGLLDHVMFVYGYDEENLYIFETTKTKIGYYSFDNEYPKIFRLPKDEIKRRWTRFGRTWLLTRNSDI